MNLLHTHRRSATIRLIITLILIAGATNHAVLGSQLVETSDFTVATHYVEQYEQQYGAENVLLVIDIDNTLLAMNHDLGSDQWFEWQCYLLEHQPESRHLVAKDFSSLLEIQGKLFMLAKMHPPQDDLPKLIGKVQARGIRTLVLTSRGPNFRVATERELSRNGYDFAKSTLPTPHAPRGPFKPYDIEEIVPSGLTEEEARMFGLGSPRSASYANGVFMTAGQHKGAMLLVMLEMCDHPFQAVVFVDDHGRHVSRVYDALTRREIDVTAVHYQREDENVDRFNYSDKSEASRRWQRLDSTLKAVFD